MLCLVIDLRLLYGAGDFLQVPVRYRTIEHFSSKVEWNCRIWIGRGIAYNMFLENFCSRRKGYILLLQQSNMAELSWMKRVDIYRGGCSF